MRNKKIFILLIVCILFLPNSVFALNVFKQGRVPYGSWGTGKFYSGNTGATYFNTWCIQPTLPAPSTAIDYASAEITGNDIGYARWYTYYMYNAPGDRAAGHAAYQSVLGANYSADQAYLLSHLLLAKVAGNNWSYEAPQSLIDQVNSLQNYLDVRYNGEYPASPPSDFHVYLLTNGAGKQAMISWEQDEIDTPEFGYVTISKTKRKGNYTDPIAGISFALCSDYATCVNHDSSWYTPENCNGIPSAADGHPTGSSCLHVLDTGTDGKTYLGWIDGSGAWLEYKTGDTSGNPWLYVREVRDNGRPGDPNRYKVTWDDGSPRVYSIQISSRDRNVITDEYLLKKNANAWEYPNGFQNDTSLGSEDAITNGPKYGAFRIKKKFSSGSETTRLDGWQFQVYNSSGTLVDTLTTGADGYTSTYGLNSEGKYNLEEGRTFTIKEKVDANGFAINSIDSSKNGKWKPVSTSDTFTIGNSDLGTVKEISYDSETNERFKYCLQVEKSDSESSSTKLSGFKFEISGNSSKNCTTGSNGKCIIKDLDYGNYTVIEKSGQANYWVSGTDSKSISGSQLTKQASNGTCTISTSQASFTNYKKYCCLKVKKVDTHNNLLSGSSFSISLNGSTVTKTDANDGSNDGYVTFFTGKCNSDSLRTFTAKEETAPNEFRKTQASVSVKEELLPKNKTASEAENICKDVNGVNSNGTKIINSSGTVTAKNDKYLINWYKERENGSNTNNAEFKVYTTINGTKKYVKATSTSSFENWSDKSGSTTKKCYVFDSLVAESSATTFKSMDTHTNGVVTNGEVCIVGFDNDEAAGTNNDRTYTVEETKSLDYHTFGNSKTKNIKIALNYYPEGDNTLFKNYRTEFRFTKTVTNTQAGDSVTNGNWNNLTTSELRKIPFKVYPSSGGNPLKFRKTSDGVYEDERNNIDKPSSGEVTDTLYLDNNRSFVIYHLLVGDYVLKEEKKCCDSTCASGTCTNNDNQCIGYYHPNDAGQAFTITRCSSPNATSCGSGNYGIVTKTLSNTPTEVEFTKKDIYNEITPDTEVKFVDEAERSAFDNIVFGLKDSSNRDVQLVYVGRHVTDASHPCMNDNDYSIYRYVNSNETLPSGTSRVTDLHTCGGHIHITNLCRSNTYKMVEKSVPDNSVFQGTSAAAVFNIPFSKPNSDGLGGANCCNNTSRTTNTKATISDEPTEIQIYKKNYNPNENIKEGSDKKQTATFEVYRCAKSVSKCSRSTATYGPIKFKDIKQLGNTGRKTYEFLPNQSDSGITSLKLDNTNGDNARIVLTYLPANYKYVVVETNAPDGYYNVEGELADVEVIASTTENDIRNYNRINYPTRIMFTKNDFYKYYNKDDLDKAGSSNKIFDSMTFQLHDKDGNVIGLYEANDSSGNTIPGQYRLINKKGEHAGTIKNLHSYKGNIVITHIYRNEKYYLEETASDTEGDFVLPNNIDNSGLNLPGSMSGNKHPIVKYEMGNLVPNSSDPNEIPESLTQEIYNDGTRVVFEKRDSVTGELIDDENNMQYVEDDDYKNVRTTFNVYRCAKTVSNCSIDNGELVYFENRTYIKDINNEDITNDIASVTPPVLAYKYSKENKSNGKVKDLVTDRGVLVLAYLPSKNYKYILYEKTAPNGYYQPKKAEAQTPFTVKDSSLTNGDTYETLTSLITNTPTEIHFTKKDMYDYYNKDDLDKVDSDIKMFDSMKFVLRNKEGKILKLKCSDNYESTGERTENRCKTGEYRYLPIDDENTIETLYTLSGNMTITHLYRNEVYYIEEVAEDTEGNFILPDYLIFNEPLPFDNKGHPVVKYIVPENEPASSESVTQIIENVPSRVIFQKRDSKYNYLIPDERTTFNVYQCSLEVEKCTPDIGKIINFSEHGIIGEDKEDTEKEVYKYKKLNEDGVTNLHPYLGELILRYLPTKYKYVLVETVSPQGYMLPSEEKAYTYFTISETKVEVEEIQVPNKPVSILLRKYAQDGELLEGAVFNISKAKNCNMNVAPNKVEREELLKLKTIRDGVYEVRPMGDTTEFRTCEDEPDRPCNDIHSTLTYPEFQTEVYGNSMGDFEALVNSRNEKINIEEGEALIQYLDFGGCYIIEEVKAPKGYTLPAEEEDRFIMVKVTDEEKVIDTYEELINTPTPFSFYKQDEYGKPLDGAKYKLQKLNDNKKYVDVPVSLDERYENEKVYKVDLNSSEYIMETNGGKATVSYLEEGQYRVIEVEAPEGYELPNKSMNVATFFIDNQGRVYGSSIIANKPKTEVKEYKPESSATFIVNIDTGQKIIKYGLIIGIIILIIMVLIIFNRKKINKKDE